MIIPAHALPLVVLVPLVGGALIPALCHRREQAAWACALAVTALTFAVSALLVARLASTGPVGYAAGGWAAPYGVQLRLDGFGSAIGVFSLLAVLVVLFSRRYVPATIAAPRIPLYYALVTINLGGMNGFMITGDLFNLYVFMEVVSVSAYALVAMARGPSAALAALRYLFLGAVSSLLVLFAIGVIFAQTGTLNMADAAPRLARPDAAQPAALALGALTIGFLVKAALFPLHVWLPDAHASAPGPVSAILSAIVVKAGVIGTVRVLQIFGETAGGVALWPVRELFVWLGALSVVAGALMALAQRDLKQILAYSTVTNIGYIFLGLGVGSAGAIAGASVHVVNHAVTKAALFLAAAAMIHQTGCRHIHDLRGLGHRMPLTGSALGLALLSLAGAPATAGFVGKWQIALGAIESGRPMAAVIVVVGGLLVLAYGFRVINALFFRLPTQAASLTAREAPPSMLIPVLVLAGGSVLLGLGGAYLLALVTPAVATLTGPG